MLTCLKFTLMKNKLVGSNSCGYHLRSSRRIFNLIEYKVELGILIEVFDGDGKVLIICNYYIYNNINNQSI